MSVKLQEIHYSGSKDEWNMLSSLASENGFENLAFGLSYEQYIHDFLPKRKEYSIGKNLPQGFVPDTYFILYKDKTPVGIFKVRPRLNDYLRNHAGHIGYAIDKEFRRRGLATQGLSLALQWLKKNPNFKDTHVLASCHKDNQASLHVMLNNGGRVYREDEKEYYIRF